MTRSVVALLLIVCAVSADAKTRSRKGSSRAKKPYCTDVKTIADCKPEGCSKTPGDTKNFDPKLNEQKNRFDENNQPPVDRTIGWMKSLQDPQNFTEENKDDRSELQRLGEGTKIRVVAWVLAVRHEGQETCNCGLLSPSGKDTETDNHIVLIDPGIKNPKRECLECNSITAEFTPRVRRNHHPNFTYEKLFPLINKSPPIRPSWKGGKLDKALLARLTGYLLFDSHHFLNSALVRENNWEIHPVLHFEYCPSGDCKADSDQGWKDLERD